MSVPMAVLAESDDGSYWGAAAQGGLVAAGDHTPCRAASHN